MRSRRPRIIPRKHNLRNVSGSNVFQTQNVGNKNWFAYMFALKGIIMYFFQTKKHNVHRFTLNLHSLKITIVESFPWNFTYWGAVVFEKFVKVTIFVSALACKDIFTSYTIVLVNITKGKGDFECQNNFGLKWFCDLFYSFLKNYTTLVILVSNIRREAFHYHYLQSL